MLLVPVVTTGLQRVTRPTMCNCKTHVQCSQHTQWGWAAVGFKKCTLADRK